MLRQQFLGDRELLRDALAGREDPEIRLEISDRLRVTRALMDQVGLPEPEERVRRRFGWEQAAAFLLLILLTTAAVDSLAYLLGGGDIIPSLYIPVVAFARIRHGKRVAIWATLGCALAYFSTPPFVLMDELHGAIAFSAMLFGVWIGGRDAF